MTSLILSGLLLAPVAAQVYMGQERDPNAFTWVQPLNTTILGQYGHSEPVYPSPHTSGAGWKEAYDKARDFVAELTLEEKSDMVTGVPGPCIGNIYPIPRLNFSGLCLHDGPVAIRAVDYSSTFPSGVTVAASWDKALMYERYLAMGREFRGKGAHVALAPSVGPLGRVVFGGRNWEGFSPDPYLSGVAMELGIRGIQDAGVQAVAKHWLANEQETARNPIYRPDGTVQFEALSSNLDDRTTHELYMWPFANAVHANAAAVMCSYQRINGSYACQNSKILNGLMKKELGFQGYIMSDWYAVHSGVASVEAGLDMDMPGTPRVNKTRLPDLGHGRMSSFFGGNITIGVNNGTMSEARLNDMIERIMSPYFHLHQDQDFPTVDSSSVYLNTFSQRNTWFNDEIWDIDYNEGPRNVRADHPEIIRRHAAESTVLLKNINNALPLKSPRYLGIFGNGVGEMQNGPLNRFGANESLEYGTYAVGGGSGAARLSYLVTPLEALHAKAREDGTLAEAWLNNTMISTSNVSSLWSWRGPDACLVFLKGWAREVVDREFLDLDYNGNGIVESVARQCNNTIVITHSAGSNNLPFADHPNVTGILLAHYPGEQAGNSIVDVLYGKVNPSGRLPYTVAYNESDWNAPLVTNIQTNGTEDWQSWFDEGLEIDYRYFDAHNISVRYPFGFGLSYTTFGLSDINIKASRDNITSTPESAETIPGGNPNLWKILYTVEAVVRNTGSVAGSAVPQLYVSFPDSVPDTPPQQLRGFEKIQLGAGESRMAKFELMRRDISFWDIVTQQWVIPEGEFTVSVGFSSRDLIESATVNPINGSG
ncbi:putative beta-glucosidase G [Fusarium oxysporum f. sp. cubense]|uniref:Beta-glucosidase cel3A n=1 Tax=Fusarium oxysporum f. sp. cubense TaxID=61366 RepID=A0A559LLU0_FUSOC|nr:putative beta-glucosidase G [Fusarium oxysporum f. sp. cubense]